MKHHGWAFHPGIRKAGELSRGERAADAMKRALATWPALIVTCACLLVWILTRGFGVDPSPYFRLNLALSCFAALQCFVLLIANKRGEEVAAELAKHDYEVNVESRQVLAAIDGLTRSIDELTRQIHERVVADHTPKRQK